MASTATKATRRLESPKTIPLRRQTQYWFETDVQDPEQSAEDNRQKMIEPNINPQLFSNRRGTSSIQYAIVLLICIAVSTAAAHILSHSFRSLDGLSHSVAWKNDDTDPAQKTTADVAKTLPQNRITEINDPQLIQFFVVACTLLVFGFSYLYIRQGKKIRNSESKLTCHVEFLEKKNEALESVLSKRQRIHNQLRLRHLEFGAGSVGDIMSTNVSTVLPSLNLVEADEILKKAGYRRTIVVNEKNELSGVLSRKDISSKTGNIVADVMTDTPKTATADMEIRIALTILLQNRISCLPVVNGNEFIGLISTSDLLIYLQCLLSTLEPSDQQQVVSSAQFN